MKRLLVLKRLGAAFTLVLVLSWSASWWWAPFFYPLSWFSITLTKGGILVYYNKAIRSSLLETRRGILASGRAVWEGYWRAEPSTGMIIVPLWIPAALVLLPTAAAWRLDAAHRRRARAGLCPACGYNLAGLAAGLTTTCPECGELITRSAGAAA